MRTKLSLLLLVVTLVNEGKTSSKWYGNVEITNDTESLRIECSRAEKLNLTKISEPNLHQVRKVYLRGCVVEKNINFSLILQNIGINNIELTELRLSDNEIADLPENIFANLTNLQLLALPSNKIKLLHEGLFTQQKELTHLYLDKNEISYLPENIFENLSKLKELYLHRNLISNLPKNTFVNLTNLQILWLEYNKVKILHDGLFTQQMKLKQLTLGYYEKSDEQADAYINYLKELHDSFIFDKNHKNGINDSFTGLRGVKVLSNKNHKNGINESFASLRRVTISNGIVFPSNLDMLGINKCEFEYDSSRNVSPNTIFSPTGKVVNSPPVIIFANQKKVTKLFLSQNELTDLDDELFNGLNELYVLDLSYNNLTTISRFIFRELRNIGSLSLDHNQIESIHPEAFVNTKKLLILDLSHNQLRFFDTKPFWHLDKLSALNLSNNYLTALPSDWEGMKTLHFLDLGHNNISSYEYNNVHTTRNNIYYKANYQLGKDDYSEMTFKSGTFFSMFLNNNSLKCDCTMYRFLLVREKGPLNEFVKQLPAICGGRCNETEFSQDCPNECPCMMNLEKNLELHCENYWLSDNIPVLRQMGQMKSNKSIELYINKNFLTELPNLQSNEHVITIQASHNRIKDLKLENIPPNLRFLDVSYNLIKTISVDVIDALYNHKKIKAFLIVNNLWQCECSANTEKFIQLFTTETFSITDFQETNCQLPSGDIELSRVNDHCAMKKHNDFVITVAVISVIIGSLVIFLVTHLSHKYKKIIKIWLYAHNICLCCIGGDEFDKDKKFDAFISYSYHDEDVAIEILNELEKGNPTFKICIHGRDFVPGRLIQTSIAEHMDNSCRTIIILSKNFLRSVWGMSEFRRAYETGLAERRMRLIIVINGDIGSTEQLDPTIKSYLKTHTYIKWGDPWFWQKMRYALPHRNRNTLI